jgi:L-fuconolactonase
MLKIDAHQHFWKYEAGRHQWISPQMKAIRHDFLPNNLKHILLENEVEGTVVIQVDQTEQETDFLIELANENSFIKGIVGWVDLQAYDIEERLYYYTSFNKLKGFRHIIQAEKDPNFMLNPSFLNGIAALSKGNFAFDILITEKQLAITNLIVKRFPNQKFVINHLAKPKIATGQLEPWARQIKEIAKNENCCCKLSGLVTENDWNLWNEVEFIPYLDVVLEAFGTKRLMFGSDWPVCMLAASYSQVIEIIENHIEQFTKTEKNAIWHQNATDFYHLK